MANQGQFSAQIDRVEVVGGDEDGLLNKGLGVIKSRISLLSGQHAVYNIRVACDGTFWSVKKRFSEFVHLHNAIKLRFGPNLPVELPAKTAVRLFSPDKLDDRKNALNAYLKEICCRSDWLTAPEVQAFFSPEGTANPAIAVAAGAPAALAAAPVLTPTIASSAPVPVLGAPPGAPVRLRRDSEDDLIGWDK